MKEIDNKEKHYFGHRVRSRERFVKGGSALSLSSQLVVTFGHIIFLKLHFI